MDRGKLLDVATRFAAWISTKPVDSEAFATIVSRDVVVPIPYPGSTADFAGLVSITEKIHEASPDFKMTLKESIVDEKDSKVVVLMEATGTQVGEWFGIPGTNKTFDNQGFVYVKVNPDTGLIVELSMISQDLLFLQQIGAFPMPPA